jgi:NADPH2:quinone reductase
VPDKLMRAMAGRLDQSMPVGNEGAGIVVEAGASPAAQALLGRTVAAIGGAMYSQLRCVKSTSACRCRPARRRPTVRRASSTR